MVKNNSISVTQAAELLGLTTRQMRRLAATIPGAFKIGQNYVLPRAEVLELKSARERKKRAQDSNKS